jgi:uncharacterized protein
MADDLRHDGYLSSKLEGRLNPAKGGFGVYAHERVCAGELLVVWGGSVTDYETLITLPAIKQIRSVQVEEDRYLVSHSTNDPADYFNHCCDPNAGLSGQIALVARRDIEPGEEVCFDYAMSDASPYDEFECECGLSACRKRITGNDWMLPELQERYAGNFSPYIQRRIERLKASQQATAI